MLRKLGFDQLKKQARLQVGDIEDDIGARFRDSQEPFVRRLIKEQEEKRFPLRHSPVLTAGVGHAISRAKAKKEIKNKIIKKNLNDREEARKFIIRAIRNHGNK